MEGPFFWLRRILPQAQKSSLNTPPAPGQSHQNNNDIVVDLMK
jgi:hypothetical protein